MSKLNTGMSNGLKPNDVSNAMGSDAISIEKSAEGRAGGRGVAEKSLTLLRRLTRDSTRAEKFSRAIILIFLLA